MMIKKKKLINFMNRKNVSSYIIHKKENGCDIIKCSIVILVLGGSFQSNKIIENNLNVLNNN